MNPCDSVLKDGVFDTILLSQSKSLSENLTEWLESVDYGEFQKAQSSGLNIGLPIKGVPVKLEASFTQDKFNEWKKEVSTGSSRQFTEEETMQILSKSASQAVLDAWSHCMGIGAGMSPGLHYNLTPSGSDFILEVRWIPNSMTDFPPTVVPPGLQVTGATPSSTFPIGMEIPLAGFSIILTRTGTGSGTIILNTTKGTVNETIPAIPAPTPPAPKLPAINLKLFTASGGSKSDTPETTLTVPAGYKIIGGGARVNWSGYGNLLTASFPKDERTWVARSKAHRESDPANIDVFAIALHDPTDEWEVDIFSSTSSPNLIPSASVAVGSKYVLTGGGAEVHWSTEGSLLTASHPEGSATWVAKSKAHINAVDTSITAYAIGIRARNGVSGPSMKVFVKESASAQHPSTEVSVDAGYSLVGGGARVNWTGQGNLLTASFPNGSKWQVASKDHEAPESCTITAFAIGIKP
jgi:hypothetical protein